MLAVQVFRIREYLRDASRMYYDGRSADARVADALDGVRVRVDERWK